MDDIQLNHIYLVTDKSTYDIIKNSEIIRSLANIYEQRNSSDNQIGWEGFYIRGKNTYIELFYPQERYPYVGISGIGMGVDQKGALDKIYNHLKEKEPEWKIGSFNREGKLWFDYLATKDSYYDENHSFWIMEYASEYFIENSHDISRRHYNAEKYHATKPFLDIDGFSIAFKPKGKDLLKSHLETLGMVPIKKNLYATSEGVEIQLHDENARNKGIFQINLSLNTTYENSIIYDLGNSTLKIHGKKATWDFAV